MVDPAAATSHCTLLQTDIHVCMLSVHEDCTSCVPLDDNQQNQHMRNHTSFQSMHVLQGACSTMQRWSTGTNMYFSVVRSCG